MVEDATALVRAEIALAKAEIMQAARQKSRGTALLGGAGVLAWLGIQGLLITIAFAIAAAGLPGWAAAAIVTLVLLLTGAVLALMGKQAMKTKLSLDTTKRSVEEDVAWVKTHLPTKSA
ncbi:MAG: phage holin family protein [Egibacteraceae bacterium]